LERNIAKPPCEPSSPGGFAFGQRRGEFGRVANPGNRHGPAGGKSTLIVRPFQPMMIR
jgi:hypothetical protein